LIEAFIMSSPHNLKRQAGGHGRNACGARSRFTSYVHSRQADERLIRLGVRLPASGGLHPAAGRYETKPKDARSRFGTPVPQRNGSRFQLLWLLIGARPPKDEGLRLCEVSDPGLYRKPTEKNPRSQPYVSI
jgi:hypothetical protein